MKLNYIIPFFTLISIVGCEELERPNTNQFVIEGFITAGESVNDIKIKETVAIDDTITDLPITTAIVSVSADEQLALLEYDLATQKYVDPEEEFLVNVGSEYQIEIIVDGLTASASTEVPEVPTGLSLTDSVLIIPPLALNFGLRNEISRLFEEEVSTFSWSGVPGRSYFVVIESKEGTLDPILPDGIPKESLDLISSFRFISAPSEDTSFTIIGVALETYGKHMAKVYSVNQEYVDLFNSETQDSRDLNDPPSNISNGLGIFTAFAVDSIAFEVRRE